MSWVGWSSAGRLADYLGGDVAFSRPSNSGTSQCGGSLLLGRRAGATVQVGQSFAAAVQARDLDNNLVTSFNGSVMLTALVPNPSPTLLITEVETLISTRSGWSCRTFPHQPGGYQRLAGLLFMIQPVGRRRRRASPCQPARCVPGWACSRSGAPVRIPRLAF